MTPYIYLCGTCKKVGEENKQFKDQIKKVRFFLIFSSIKYVVLEIIRNIAPRITRKYRKLESWIF